MATPNKETIKNLIQLSRIDCTQEEQESLLDDLRAILSYVEQLQEINTDSVPACLNVLEDMNNVTREDVVGELLSRDLFLSNAPSQVGGMIRVPPVIKQN